MIRPPAPPCRSLQRRQAHRPAVREAAGQHSCALRISAFPSPRTPHLRGLRPWGGKTSKTGGAAIVFCNATHHRRSPRPVDYIACHYPKQGSTKRRAAFPSFKPPRVGWFCPRVSLFIPRVHFSTSRGVSLSLFLFIEREEEKRGPKSANGKSTGWRCSKNEHPRVHGLIHGFSVDEKIGKSESWCGLQPVFNGFHGSTGGSVCGLPLATSSEVGHD